MRDVFLGFFTFIIFSVFFALLILNFLLGCGETHRASDGRLITGECISPIEMFTRD